MKLPRVAWFDGTDLPELTVGRVRTLARLYPVLHPELVQIASELHDKLDHELVGQFYSDDALNRIVMTHLI